MPRLHRESAPPPGAMLSTRNTRLYGTRDDQIAGAAEYARGCPSPDRAIVRTSTRSAMRAARTPVESLLADCTPPQHQRNEQVARHNMEVAQRAVRDARERGDEPARIAAAKRARELRAAWLKLTGGVERIQFDIDMPETWASGQA